jgi:hypothetical protein
MGSTPVARTTSKFGVALETLNGIKAYGVNHVSHRAFSCRRKIGKITVKPEQEPEQLNED